MSKYIIPLIFVFLIIYGKAKQINVYNTFCQGAKKSFELVLGIFPYIVAIMICVVHVKLNIIEILTNHRIT